MSRNVNTVRTAVFTPEEVGLLGRIPVAFSDTLKHCTDAYSVPVDSEVEAIEIARIDITDDREVSMVIDGTVTLAYLAVRLSIFSTSYIFIPRVTRFRRPFL